jgi:hypothetical protein
MTTAAPALLRHDGGLTLAEAIDAVRELLGGAPADEVTCEVTRHGTLRIVARRSGAGAPVVLRTGLRK